MTGHDYRFRPQAHDDVIALAQHIASDNLPAAERFLDAVEATCARIAELPRSGATRPFNLKGAVHPEIGAVWQASARSRCDQKGG
jgi:plasmid stabilization system protein ParE